MNPFHRLHALRMENDAARYAQEEMRGRFTRLESRHEEGTAPRAVTAFNLFQTPPELAARMAALLPLERYDRVLEPSAGLGRLLDALKPAQPLRITAVEVAPQLAGELYRQERGIGLKQRDFLTITPAELGEFDAVIMNPPFHMRADVRHIQHALSFLRPGGVLVALAMDTPHREVLRPLANHWEKIPAGAFKSEGTKIAAVLMRIVK